MVHAFKYPYMTVNGFLLGQQSAPDLVDIVDAVPVLHYQSDFTPGWAVEAEVRIDIGFGMVRFFFVTFLQPRQTETGLL